MSEPEADVCLDDSWAGGRECLEVCPDFRSGKCQRGLDRCKFAHPNEDCRQVMKCVNVCLDSLMRMKKCNFEDCKYYHPPSHIQFNDVVKGRIPLCQKFMESVCHDTECPSAHPEKEEQIVKYVALCDDENCRVLDCPYYHPPAGQVRVADTLRKVDICYDYTQGRCHRSTCKFSHDVDEGHRRRSPGFARRSLTPRGARRRSRSPVGAPRALARRRSRSFPKRYRSRSGGRRGRSGERYDGKGQMADAMWNMCNMMMSMWGKGDKGKEEFARMAESFGKGDWGASSSDWDRRRGSPARSRHYDDRRRDDDRGRERREICRDWINKKCDRGGRCRFEHTDV